jgi:hypothetical protein
MRLLTCKNRPISMGPLPRETKFVTRRSQAKDEGGVVAVDL